jgi:hypothetical protein
VVAYGRPACAAEKVEELRSAVHGMRLPTRTDSEP